MPRIHVCPLSKVEEVVRATGARSLITLISAGTEVRRPAPIALDRHLRITVSDIVEPMDGHILPDDRHIADLLEFGAAWDRRHPLLIHCYAGVSRSTAAAFVVACALAPDQAEADVARRLRKASPTATPNRRLVQLADDVLGRGKRMVAAVVAIGAGVACVEGMEFELPLR